MKPLRGQNVSLPFLSRLCLDLLWLSQTCKRGRRPTRRKEIFARTHKPANKPTTPQHLKVTVVTDGSWQEARGYGAPQVSHDKRTRLHGWHRTCFQISSRMRATICMHFWKGNISWVTGELMRSLACTDPKRSIFLGQNSCRNNKGGLQSDRQPPADSPPGDHLITIGKETMRKSFEKLKKKVSWCDRIRVDLHLRCSTCFTLRISTQKKTSFPRSEFTLALHLDIMDADQLPNADSPPRDHLITIVKQKKKIENAHAGAGFFHSSSSSPVTQKLRSRYDRNRVHARNTQKKLTF